MNDTYFTQTGDRPDLGAIEVNAPEGYIGTRILPIVPVNDKSGTVYYNTLTADVAAQTNRAAYAAPSSTGISTSSTTYNCAEAVKRGKITPDEAKQMGGIEKADMVGAKFAKRSVMNAIETDIATNVLGGTKDETFDPAKIRTQVQVALQDVRLYEGRSALVASTWTIQAMLQQLLNDSGYGPALARLVSGSSGVEAVRGMSLAAWKQALALFFGVDDVLAGDDTVWNATAIQGRFAICKLDDGSDPLSHKWRPVLGKTFQYLPDGVQPFVLKSVADYVNVTNLYDAYVWYDTVILNAGALYLFDGVTG